MKMKQIEIGTCIPGTEAEKWIPPYGKRGL